MESSLVIWALGTGIIVAVFSRAAHRWADRRTAIRSAASRPHHMKFARLIDSTPSPHAAPLRLYHSELTPCP